MLGIVKETFEHREKHGIVRKDMLQLLMQLRNTGSIDEDDSKPWSLETTDDGKHPAGNPLPSHALFKLCFTFCRTH